MNFGILAGVAGNIFKVHGASEKITQYMKQVPEINTRGGEQINEDAIEGTIEFKNVDFNYPTKPDVRVTKNLSLKVEKNHVVALVGQSGCGKSSLIALIERFYEPIKGEILFSGKNIKDLDPKWYKKQIGIV